jgi:hypothetical protein
MVTRRRLRKIAKERVAAKKANPKLRKASAAQAKALRATLREDKRAAKLRAKAIQASREARQ